MIKTVITSITDRRKTRKLENISYRRNAENFLNLPGNIRFENDNLIVFIKLIMRLYRFHPLLAVKLFDHIVGRKNVYTETFLPIVGLRCLEPIKS
jgi:hypothetical protein